MAQMATAVLNDSFKRIGEASLDERKRVSLAKTLESLKQILGGELRPSDPIWHLRKRRWASVALTRDFSADARTLAVPQP